VQGAANTEHCQNTALHVWEIPGKNPNKKTGGLQNRAWDFFFADYLRAATIRTVECRGRLKHREKNSHNG